MFKIKLLKDLLRICVYVSRMSSRKCNRCHASKLDECFSINSKGELYKLCDNCRSKHNSYYKEYNETKRKK